MTHQQPSSKDIDSCRKIILDFTPAPVTSMQREALENYQKGKQEDVRQAIKACGAYGECLLALLSAREDEYNAVEHLRRAAEFAIEYAGVSNGSELYTKLGETLPDCFDSEGAIKR